MDIFHVLAMIGGLSLFLFGMSVMGQSLERRAGSRLRTVIEKLTTGKTAGLITGLGVTAVIQSSSATTVMVVGFVNSGLMTLRQAINVIMGANIGTTVTAWVLSLAGIEGSNMFVRLLKPSSFTPVLAFIGILCYMFSANPKKKETGAILLGFATLMYGMEAMSGAVSGLRDVPAFQELFILFKNPVLGVAAGALLTAVIQSSSASVGILQALAVTGRVSWGAAIPIIMGQNIGTCVTAMISSVGANKNAKRAAMIHLLFNMIGTGVWLSVFCICKAVFLLPALDHSVSLFGIAAAHTVFNLLCTLLLLPMTGILERMANMLIRDSKEEETAPELDERLFATPSIALERCREVMEKLAGTAMDAMKESLDSLENGSGALADSIREKEELTDHYEDILSTYLVHLSTSRIRAEDSAEAAGMLRMAGDFERIADYGVNLLESAEELRSKGLKVTEEANEEYHVISSAIREALDHSFQAFLENDRKAAENVEPLGQVIDILKEKMRTNHIRRLQEGSCSIHVGFVWSDILTSLERVLGHCSNIAGYVMDMAGQNMNLHESLRDFRNSSPEFEEKFHSYLDKYDIRAKQP